MSLATKANTDLDVTKATPQQLAELGKAIESEIGQLTQNHQQLLVAIRRYGESKGALAYLDQRQHNKQILVPLTSSLYVPGELMDNNVLVEAGAGYFIEKENKDAVTYCDKKSATLTENAKKVAEYINQKKLMMGKVQGEYNKRMQAV